MRQVEETLQRMALSHPARRAAVRFGMWSLVILLLGGAAGAVPGATRPGGRTGRVIYLFHDALWAARPDGTEVRRLTRGMPVYAYDVAPDGMRVAFAVGMWRREGRRRKLVESEVWVVNADGTGLRRIAASHGVSGRLRRVGHLRWSPNGRFLALDAEGDGNREVPGGTLYVARLPGGGIRRVSRAPVQRFEWTPEGEIRYEAAPAGAGGGATWVVAPAGTAGPRPADPSPVEGPPGPDRAAAARGHRGAVTAIAPPLPPGAVPDPQPASPGPPPAKSPAPHGSGAGAG